MNTTHFSVSKVSDQPEVSSSILSIHFKPIKFLGHMIEGSISDRNSWAELTHTLLALKSVIYKSLSFTALIHSKGPMASANLWNTNFCSILNWNRKSVFIRKWLHLYHSTSSLCFYSSVCLCPLPIKSLWSALKALKISGHLVLRSSEDSLVSRCVPKVQTGHSKVEHAALSCENNIKINQVCSPGSSHNNRHGLGYTITPKVPRNKLSKH